MLFMVFKFSIRTFSLKKFVNLLYGVIISAFGRVGTFKVDDAVYRYVIMSI